MEVFDSSTQISILHVPTALLCCQNGHTGNFRIQLSRLRWYGRNLKIFNNILGITEDTRARILVIYGLGHIHLLNQFANESGYFEVANLNDILD